MERGLSNFQELCEHRLDSTLRSLGRKLVDREIAGEAEAYIHAAVQGTAIEIWIYEDEAEFRTGDSHRIFETPDFDSSEELIDAFMEAVAEEIRRVNEK